MRTTYRVAAVFLILVGGAVAWWLSRGPDASQFADLREPRLSRLNDQRVLLVEATGDPNVVAGSAFKLLFNTYFKLNGVSRMSRPPAPRARWTFSPDTPKDKWIGRYAMPVPGSVNLLPTASAGSTRAAITTWAYGEVAEVLHVGPYSTEEPDITRLHQFISARGYRVVGDHEEEYVKGPGMVFAGDPDKYLTIIRLRVERPAATSN